MDLNKRIDIVGTQIAIATGNQYNPTSDDPIDRINHYAQWPIGTNGPIGGIPIRVNTDAEREHLIIHQTLCRHEQFIKRSGQIDKEQPPIPVQMLVYGDYDITNGCVVSDPVRNVSYKITKDFQNQKVHPLVVVIKPQAENWTTIHAYVKELANRSNGSLCFSLEGFFEPTQQDVCCWTQQRVIDIVNRQKDIQLATMSGETAANDQIDLFTDDKVTPHNLQIFYQAQPVWELTQQYPTFRGLLQGNPTLVNHFMDINTELFAKHFSEKPRKYVVWRYSRMHTLEIIRKDDVLSVKYDIFEHPHIIPIYELQYGKWFDLYHIQFDRMTWKPLTKWQEYVQ